MRAQDLLNFVLVDGCLSIRANGVDCITLGHGQNQPPQIVHPVWGTHTISDFLAAQPDFPNVHLQYKPGLVEEIERFGRENAPLSRGMA